MSRSSQRLLNLTSFDESMTLTQMLQWIRRELNHEPESVDLYNIGKSLFQLGMYRGASMLLHQYSESQGAQPAGHHLLGYAYYHIGEYEKGVASLRRIVHKGFDNDWQLLVEMSIECDRTAEKREQERIRDLYIAPIRDAYEQERLEATRRLLERTVFNPALTEGLDVPQYRDPDPTEGKGTFVTVRGNEMANVLEHHTNVPKLTLHQHSNNEKTKPFSLKPRPPSSQTAVSTTNSASTLNQGHSNPPSLGTRGRIGMNTKSRINRPSKLEEDKVLSPTGYLIDTSDDQGSDRIVTGYKPAG